MGVLLLVALVALSFFGSVFVIGNAFYQRQQFYPAVIYLTKSNFCVSVLSSQAFILVISFGIVCKKIFFGTLRQIEFEQLVERFWYVFSETFVAFAVFRDELDAKFVIYFTTLVFFKAFHWLAEERIDFMERSPVINLMFHARILSLFFVLTYMDLYLFGLSFAPLMDSQKKSSQLTIFIIFAFEYVLLFHSLITMAFKYTLHSIDLWLENPWERKVTVLLYFDLLMSGAKVVLYTFYVYLMIDTQTVPLFVIRPFYQTLRNFKKALYDVMMSRNAIRIMNTLYPNATAEELQQGDNVCIICREEMLNENTCKKLPCNHIFHISCLTTWFQRQQTCPTCRLDILTSANNLSQQLLPDQQQPQQQQQQQQQQGQQQQFAIPRPRINFAFRFEFLRNMELLNAARAMLGQNERPPENQVRAAPERNAQNAEMGQQQQQQQQRPQSQSQTQQQSEQSQQQQPQVPNYLNMHPLQFPNIAFVPQLLPQFPLEPLLPPEELRTLTDEQLNALEGRARKNIEARIECLRNVQVLINSAIIMMQQYNNAASSSSTTTTTTTTATTTTTTAENVPGPSSQSTSSTQS